MSCSCMSCRLFRHFHGQHFQRCGVWLTSVSVGQFRLHWHADCSSHGVTGHWSCWRRDQSGGRRLVERHFRSRRRRFRYSVTAPGDSHRLSGRLDANFLLDWSGLWMYRMLVTVLSSWLAKSSAMHARSVNNAERCTSSSNSSRSTAFRFLKLYDRTWRGGRQWVTTWSSRSLILHGWWMSFDDVWPMTRSIHLRRLLTTSVLGVGMSAAAGRERPAAMSGQRGVDTGTIEVATDVIWQNYRVVGGLGYYKGDLHSEFVL